MASLSVDEFFATLLAKADELRSKGILEVGFEGFHAKLAPAAPTAPRHLPKNEEAKGPVDPLLNPHTFGLPEGSRLPGLSHLMVMDDKAPK